MAKSNTPSTQPVKPRTDKGMGRTIPKPTKPSTSPPKK